MKPINQGKKAPSRRRRNPARPPGLREEHAGIDKQIEKAFKSWAALQKKFEEIETNYGGARELIFPRLFPSDANHLQLPDAVILLQGLALLEHRLRSYEKAKNLLKESPEYRMWLRPRFHVERPSGTAQARKECDTEATLLGLLIDGLNRRRVDLLALEGRMKLGEGKRRNNPRQLQRLGDIAVDVYDYLSPIIPGERGLGRGKIRPTDPRPYKQRALAMTADLVNLAYGPYFPDFKLIPKDIKSRLQRRRRARV